ncbi:adenylate/guanylate cyclase domain-containing protein [Shimia sediminis]|uniref:adenylate/guanylate cyclase domain-containing protein n=1 Tax=Shimia sediminis TaxID=2497945 RepID=UPI0013E0E1FA|nr:adenylate/guanylate cyclase domain-containing protein [Shimia sediminis]
MRIPLTFSIFSVILLIGLTLSFSIVGYSYTRQKEAAFLATTALMERSAENLRLRTEMLIAPIDQVARQSNSWPGVTREPTHQGHPALRRLIAVLQRHPQIAAVNFGYDTGSYYMVAAASSRSPDEMDRMGAPAETMFIERVILRGEGGDGRPLTRFISAEGDFLGDTRVGPRSYDPRNRPWYQSVREGASEARSQVYLFHASRQPGLTISQRNETGVVGVDITLRQMEEFLKSDDLARDGVLAVLGPEGAALARAGAHSAGDDVLATLSARRAQQDGFRSGAIKVGNEFWIAHIDPAPFGEGTNEALVLAMPIRVLAAPIIRVFRNAILMSLAITLISVPLIWFISRGLSSPLKALSRDAERIRRFDLTQTDFKPSRVEEIFQLQVSLSRMTNSLSIFTSYVPKALVRGFLERDATPQLGGENKDLTVFFMDLENFTAMSSDLPPEETMRRMSNLFEEVTQVLQAHGATIDKYIGDAVMAFWNAPEDVEDHEAKACQAALAVRDVATAEIAKWNVQGLPLRPRIGLHCGEAIVGNVGSSDRMNYTALGATVNLAARLEAANRALGTSILISPDLKARVEGRIDMVSVGQVDLKGYKEPVEVFEVTGVVED